MRYPTDGLGNPCTAKTVPQQAAFRPGHPPASIAVSLKRMEKAGLIMRVPDPDDLRSNRIELTEAGKASADYAEQGLREVSGQSYCGFSEEEFSLLMDFYRRMRQNLTDYKEKLEGSD